LKGILKNKENNMSNVAVIAVLSGLGAALAWGICDFFGAKVSKKFGGITTALFMNVIGTVLYTLVYMVFMRSYTDYDLTAVAYALGGGVTYMLAMAAFFKGLELGPVSIVSPVGSMYPLVTTLLLVLAFGHNLSTIQGLGILLVLGGILVASGLFSKASRSKLGKGPLYALVTALFWGISWALIAQGIDLVGWQFTMFVEMIFSTLTFAIVWPLIKGEESLQTKNVRPMLKNKFLLGASVLQLLGFLSLNIGIMEAIDLAAVAVAVSATYPVLTVFLALKHFGEEKQLVPLLGGFVGIVGVIVLSLG
jgi:drug/metabolite transporter (DMT)-like permease